MRILGIDFGDVRTGFAICDPTGLLAQSLGTFVSRNKNEVAAKAKEYCEQYGVTAIVLGYPKNMNNTLGPRAEKAAALEQVLRQRFALPVVLWDERRTTIDAHNILQSAGKNAKKRKAVVDSVAAALILEGYLTFRRSHP